MSFTIITQGRRPRGLGTGPFVGMMTERAGEAIGMAIATGRAANVPDATINRSDVFTDTDEAGRRPGEPGYNSGPPVETDIPDEGGVDESELDCGCLAKRAHEALINLGMTEAETGSVGDIQAECEGDPALFYSAVSGFFPSGIPACAWYESTRNKVIAAGVVLAVGGLGIYALRRRRR